MSLTRFEREVVTASLDEPVAAVARRMRDQRVGCVVVIRERRPIGILTDRDLTVRVVAEGRDPSRTLVSDVVTYEVGALARTDGIDTAVLRMRAQGVRRMPIVDERGELVGIVTADDLVTLLSRQLADVGAGIEDNVDAPESR
jgi:CBS domain-containing protein